MTNNSDLGVEEIFAFELSSYPTALFDKWGRLREANKPQLGDAIAAVVPKSALESFEEERTVTHVLDGGSFLSCKGFHGRRVTHLRTLQACT